MRILGVTTPRLEASPLFLSIMLHHRHSKLYDRSNFPQFSLASFGRLDSGRNALSGIVFPIPSASIFIFSSLTATRTSERSVLKWPYSPFKRCGELQARGLIQYATVISTRSLLFSSLFLLMLAQYPLHMRMLQNQALLPLCAHLLRR